MDPFNGLPAEVRIKILGSIPSYATTARLIRASPIMLTQYTTTESINLREYLSQLSGTDVHDHELLQDALAIIYLGENYGFDDFDDFDEICDLARKWEAKTLPLPFHRGDNDSITKLRLLFERMSEFIDDYLSKATAQNTVEAYLQPPRLTYIDTVDSQRITLHDLNLQERSRLFKAFIKFEVLCKFSGRVAHHALTTVRSHQALELSSWENEALMCVYEYIKASYSAMFVQCTDTQTFEDYKKLCYQRRIEREDSFFVETMCYDPRYPFLRDKFPKYAADFPNALPWCGFDVLSHLMKEAKGKHEPMWMAKMCSRYDQKSYDWHEHIVRRIKEKSYVEDRNRSVRYQSPEEKEAIRVKRAHRTIHQQRASVFFDDARLCPGQEAHFPTEEEVKTEEARLKDERKMNTKKQWDEYFDKKRPNPPRYKSPLRRYDPNDDTTAKEILVDGETHIGILTPPPFFALLKGRHHG
ncbi:uncharacterized protein FSUBG_3382 [Fusarium subglutinans]|uniref:Uncharacterized protein n=1 Tax=Gibberella subglutinans TaxID=42677 RepID=A0A8H5Q5V4_GIBSU|nr:uncharacterized protein FSUBG_3382 [Fusarium subglutinans]KAF5610150.1 hypothetical protein FSUBG_3382 [Fusarium subglutinans]